MNLLIKKELLNFKIQILKLNLNKARMMTMTIMKMIENNNNKKKKNIYNLHLIATNRVYLTNNYQINLEEKKDKPLIL